MYHRLSAVLFPVMTLMFIGSIYWGYQEHQEKNSILIKAENQYQRAFHDLSYHMEQLHKELGSTLAVNSTSQAYQRKGLVNVWRLTSQAQNEINQLPLTLLPFNTTEEFLSKIANFAYKASVRDLSKQPLSEDEYKTLKTLYKNSDEIAGNLLNMQSKVLANNLRWMDVESALATETSAQDNTIIDGFKTVDKKVSEYPELNWGPSVASMYQKRSVKMLGGKKMTAEEIKKLAAEFASIKDPSAIRVVENGKGTEYESFSVSAPMAGSDRMIQMDFTKQGGKLIWYMNPKDVAASKITVDQAEKNATQFLNAHGYKGMKLTNYDEFNNVVSFTAVGSQQGVLIYPEKLIVKVALDDGEVTGLQANDYVYEHHKRKIAKPKLSAAAARKALNPGFERTNEGLAIIMNDLGKEVLCYEFSGKINGGKYRIYINADNGTEEAIELLPK
ncbi:germination protein YpeB [Paenibacillus xanthanilyticus]|uniref:Germination protein YpeB n=1 Tax=Paenibacillus xanthanilyticus TaxID=1783531 RepID=A0ABV8KCH4_9BACL